MMNHWTQQLRRTGATACHRVAATLTRWAYRLHSSEQAQRVYRWNMLDREGTLRYDYDLHAGSVVLDAGGYRGDFAAEVAARYGCTVHVFEPVPQFADAIARRFARNPRVHLHRFGLGARTLQLPITLSDDGSSVHRAGPRLLTIDIVDVAAFIRRQALGRIDLLKLNIEGGEYDLLERLLDTGLIDRIGEVQVQFHEDAVPDAAARMHAIQQRLGERFALRYQVPFVWESWRARPTRLAAAA